MRTPMLMEILKTVTTDSSYDQDFDEDEDDAFENNDAEEEGTQNNKINEPINTFGLLNEVKSKLHKNIKKYYLTLTTENLIPSILDPRFKRLDFAPEAQQISTKFHLQELFNNEKGNYQNNQTTTQSTIQSKSSTKRKTLMARLSKSNVVVINEVEEYLQLPEITLDLNPLVW